MSDAKHTPTPWQFDENNLYVYDDDADHVIATCDGPGTAVGGLPAEEIEANGEFIVRACNCHDELLAACRQALTAARMDEWDGAGSVRYEAFELLIAAIAKAEATDLP